MKREWEELDGSCMRRAIRAGLLFAGVQDDAAWVGQFPDTDILGVLVDKYPVLEWIGRNGPETRDIDNGPALVSYPVRDEKHADGRPLQHAIFVSDMHCWSIMKFPLGHAVIGWEELREQRLK